MAIRSPMKITISASRTKLLAKVFTHSTLHPWEKSISENGLSWTMVKISCEEYSWPSETCTRSSRMSMCQIRSTQLHFFQSWTRLPSRQGSTELRGKLSIQKSQKDHSQYSRQWNDGISWTTSQSLSRSTRRVFSLAQASTPRSMRRRPWKDSHSISLVTGIMCRINRRQVLTRIQSKVWDWKTPCIKPKSSTWNTHPF